MARTPKTNIRPKKPSNRKDLSESSQGSDSEASSRSRGSSASSSGTDGDNNTKHKKWKDSLIVSPFMGTFISQAGKRSFYCSNC